MTENDSSPNEERVVRCPAEGCDAEVLARGLHLHVMRKDDNAHGPSGDVPDGLDAAHAETVGSRPVDVDYPDDRESEKVMRQCLYCRNVYRGKQGIAIHFGQVVGRKNHPKERDAFVDPEDCAVVTVDENENVLSVIDEEDPAHSDADSDEGGVSMKRVSRYIAELEAGGKAEEAARARDRLLR